MKAFRPREPRTQKILVVDDTEPTRYAIARTLKNQGHEIFEAATGYEGLRLAREVNPDLITLDIHLPDILGFDVCRQLKADPQTAHIPVLQVSASYVTSKDRIHGLEGGADSYLTHPFEPPVLIATIRALLRFRETHESLAQSEERLRIALNAAPVFISSSDRELSYTWVYKAAEGMSVKDFIGKRDDEVAEPSKVAALMEAKRRVLDSGKGERVSLETVIHGCEGHFDLTIEPLIGEKGEVHGVTVAALDITSRIHSEEKVRESEEHLRLAVESGELGTWEFNPINGERRWSDRTREIFGFTKEEVLTNDLVYGAIHPDDLANVKEQMRLSLDPQVAAEFDMEFRIQLRDGTVRWVAARGKAFFHGPAANAQAHRFIGTMIDVSERRRVREELRNAKEAAESANQAKSQFLANVSHEIRTPLGVIYGLSDLLVDPSQSLQERENYARVIRRNAELLAKLIDEILDLSKIEADKLQIEKLRFDLPDLIQDVTSLLSLKAREKSLDMRVELEGPIPQYVTSDPTRVRQILINLIGNAIKFTEKGSVRLRVGMLAPPVKGTPCRVRFEVVDTGVGLNEEQSAKLFQPFTQADASTTRRFGGTGLGLMLSRRLAQSLGGDLDLTTSAPGKGSIFTFRLDGGIFQGELFEGSLETETQKPLAAPVAVAEKPLSGMRVLLVEDSVDNQIVVARFLDMAGAKIDLASDGEEGIRKALEGKYDVVLMDIQMPKLDGYEAASTLRQKNYKVPVIALTAHALKGERDRCIACGFTDYLTKPLSRKTLIETLRELKQVQ